MSLKESLKPLKQIIQENNFSDVFEACKEFKVLLVHAFPDYNQTEEIDENSRNWDREMTFEDALESCKKSIPNLCCSSVKEGDKYNRYAGRIFGVFILSGKIVQASSGDGMTYRVNEFDKLKIPKEQIEKSINEKRGKFNEINIDTRDSLILPYFDLDYLIGNLPYGINTKYGWTNFNTLISDLFRYELAMKKERLPFIGLFRGKAIKLDIAKLREYLDKFQNAIDDTESNDEDEFENENSESSYNKFTINKNILEDYLHSSKQYSLLQLAALAKLNTKKS